MNLFKLKYSELVKLRADILTEMRKRTPVGMRCCECEEEFFFDVGANPDRPKASIKLYRHLIRKHGYPNEDARMSSGGDNMYFIFDKQ